MAIIGPRTEIIITPLKAVVGAKPIHKQAMIDTGAERTIVDLQTAYDHKFRNGDLVNVFGLKHSAQAPEFDVELELPEFNIKRRMKVLGFRVNPGGMDDVVALIGRDILKDCVLIYDGKHGTVKLTS
jgi:hypothetical protein